MIEFEKKLILQKYAHNTTKSYKDYAGLFLKHVNQYSSLKDVPLEAIESFISDKVKSEQISVSYQKGLVGAKKKLRFNSRRKD